MTTKKANKKKTVAKKQRYSREVREEMVWHTLIDLMFFLHPRMSMKRKLQGAREALALMSKL